MNKPRSNEALKPAAAARPAPRDRIGRLAAWALLAILGARPLISETFERVELGFLAAETLEIGASVADTAWLDLLLLCAAAVALLTASQRRTWKTFSTLAIVALVLAAAISAAVSGEKRVALNASAHWIAVACAAVALRRWAVHGSLGRVAIAVALAGCAANAYRCISQWSYEFDDTYEMWLEQKRAMTERGEPIDTPAMVNYERRMRSREPFGYLSHPNVTASLLAVGALAAGVLVLAKRAAPPGAPRFAERLGALLLAGGAGFALWLTGSMGAIASALLAAAGCVAASPARHRATAFGLLVSAYAALVAGGAAWGVSQGTLPHVSLAFRWHYWTAAIRAWGDAPLTGIGRENFRDAYLLYKSPEMTEEVANPHNAWLSLAVETGPLGLLAGALLLFGSLWVAASALARNRVDTTPPDRPLRAAEFAPAALGAPIVLALFSGAPIGDPPLALWWLTDTVAPWLLLLALAGFCVRSCNNRGRALLALAGVFSLLIHNLVDFSLLTPAGTALLALLYAACPAKPDEEPCENATPPSAGATMPAFAVAALALAHGWMVVWPTASAESTWRAARSALVSARSESDVVIAARLAERAAWRDRLDASLARSAARMCAAIVDFPGPSLRWRFELLERASSLTQLAAQRNPRSAPGARLSAEIASRRAALLEADGRPDIEAWRDAAELWQQAVRRNPTDPRWRMGCAAALVEHCRRSVGARASCAAALDHLRIASEIDRGRPEADASRLRPAELERIRALRSAAAGGP